MKIDQIIKECKQHNSEYEIKGKLLFIPPIGEVLTGFNFEKVNDHFYLWMFAQPLFIPKEHYYFTFGNRLKNPLTGSSIYELNDESLEGVIRVISDPKNLQWLKDMKNAFVFYDFHKEKIKEFSFLRNLAFVSAYLNKNDSNEQLKEFIRLSESYIKEGYADYLLPEIERAQMLLNSSEEKRKDLFDAWTKESLKSLKLDKQLNNK